MKFKNYIYIALMVLLFVEILVVFPQKLEESRKEEAAVEARRLQIDKNAAEQTMGGVHLVESQAGKKDWELFAEKAEGDSDSKAWNLKKIKIIFYSDDKPQFEVNGLEGNIEGESRNVRIRGSVVTKSSNGYEFNTESVEYISSVRQIVSPRRVDVQAPADGSGLGMKLEGAAMVISVDKKTMEIAGPVQSRRQMKDGKLLTVSAGKALFSSENNEAQFIGAVDIKYDQMNLKGPEASFIYEKAKSSLSQILLKGGVEVSDPEKMAQAQTVSLNVLKQIYTFSGSPKVQQGDDELQGDEIVFLEGGKKVKVERVRARVENK